MTIAIGMYHPKDQRNIGALLRSADLFDVAFTYQIGGTRYRYAATDTAHATDRVPHHYFETLEEFQLYNARLTLVAVELDTHAVPLHRFNHPENVAYLLGSENTGIPTDVLDRCSRIVKIETVKHWSLNVATAGAIVLYDRAWHQLRQGAAA